MRNETTQSVLSIGFNFQQKMLLGSGVGRSSTIGTASDNRQCAAVSSSEQPAPFGSALRPSSSEQRSPFGSVLRLGHQNSVCQAWVESKKRGTLHTMKLSQMQQVNMLRLYISQLPLSRRGSALHQFQGIHNFYSWSYSCSFFCSCFCSSSSSCYIKMRGLQQTSNGFIFKNVRASLFGN